MIALDIHPARERLKDNTAKGAEKTQRAQRKKLWQKTTSQKKLSE